MKSSIYDIAKATKQCSIFVDTKPSVCLPVTSVARDKIAIVITLIISNFESISHLVFIKVSSDKMVSSQNLPKF